MKQFGNIGRLRCALWLLVLFVSSAKADMPLNGVAVYSRFGQEQFMAGLYVPRLTTQETAILQSGNPGVMELRIIDDRIFPRRFQRMWVEGIAINARDQELENFAPLMADFSNMLNIQLRRGDIFRIERTPAKTVLVQLNDTSLGELSDPLFFDLLLRSWVGPVPLSSDFKAALLVAGNIGTEPFQRFLALTPPDERKEQVANALLERRKVSSDTTPKSSVTEKTPSEAGTATAAAGAASALPAAPAPIVPDAPGSATDNTKTPDSTTALPDADAPAEPAPKPPVADVGSSPEDKDESVLLSAETEVTVSASDILIEQRYISSLIRRTQSFAKYPRIALKRNQEGTVRLTVTLSPTGSLLNIEFEEESRYDSLNKAAREAIESANPFPPMPPELMESQFQFSVPIVFSIQ